jgi:hypothetical protein
MARAATNAMIPAVVAIYLISYISDDIFSCNDLRKTGYLLSIMDSSYG